MKITLNPLKNENFEIVSWPITGEPPRISLDTEEYSYSLVNTDNGVYVEIWKLDLNGEHAYLVSNILLPC